MANNEPDYDNLFFEEKKMHTPQVGDVWEYQGKQYYISSVDDRYITVWCKSNDEIIRRHIWVARSFNVCFTYLGKSKANIDDLFKKENEE